ncbi:MAG TPA: DEAD/DEAH box helicase family protein [Pyrinomonadaceae bacterium]|nr:DEAD/DEAH box helicase family protein [Pyrinomonadaceae bacterium]
MNEADTRAELIEPQLRASGWGENGSRILREVDITAGKIQSGGVRNNALKADYILEHNNRKLASVEAKSDETEIGEGVMQAKLYAEKLELKFTYAANGREIYEIEMGEGREGTVSAFPTPEELWDRVFGDVSEWQKKFDSVPFEDVGGTKQARYYQEIAVNNTMKAIAANQQRILLTLATGTGKTFIAFQIAWKLFQTRWNLQRDGGRRPRILFLADRNILADQAFNAFSAFSEDALVRIRLDSIRKNDRVPTNGSIFFTIFQTFMSGPGDSPYFGDYPEDFFDLVIIDECHRGGANDESNWRAIMDYFKPAVQLGLTATPKRKDNVDTYRYFGEPVYTYSLKDGIADGFLTPFKVRRIKTTLDEYVWTPDDTIVEGEIEAGKVYEEKDFNRTIEIEAREKKRVEIFLGEADQNEKALVFGATQAHAALLRNLINQLAESNDPMYCVRVTANDGNQGEQFLREFQDNEKSIPTILTTSQKLSTGVDARNVRNIVLMRPVNSMIEFKQIIGRGTRLFDGKDYFTIYDFVDAYYNFLDPEWDGEPILEICDECGVSPCECVRKEKKPCPVCGERPCVCEKGPPEPCEKCGQRPCVCKKKVKIRLGDGKERQIQHMTSTSFLDGNGNPMSAEQFLESLFGVLPQFFRNEDHLREIWSKPSTRRELLHKLADAGFGPEQLGEMQKLIDAERSDVFDVLEYVAYSVAPITRAERVENARTNIFAFLDREQREFLDFVLSKYIETGVSELDEEKLPQLLQLKYLTIDDGVAALGDVPEIRSTFINFQKHLYDRRVA